MKLGLTRRMSLAAALLIAAAGIGSATLATEVAQREVQLEFTTTFHILTENLSRNAAHAIFVESGDELSELAENLMEARDVIAIHVTGTNGDTILRRGPEQPPARAASVRAKVTFDAAAEVPVGITDDLSASAGEERIVGYVDLFYSTERLEGALRRVRMRVWGMAFAASGLGIAIAITLARRMVRPLKELAVATETIALGDLEARVTPPATDDEIAHLADAFNKMAENLDHNAAELRRTYAELARAERLASLGQFTAVIAHELRNPLGIILSSSQVIANPERPPEMKQRAAEIIGDEVRRLDADLTAFLSFARPKAPDKRPVPTEAFIAAVLQAFRTHPSMLDAPISLQHNITQRASALLIDRDQMHRVLLNLLINAREAIGDAQGSITISVDSRDGQSICIVDDTGAGIPEIERLKIFEPFHTTRKKGTGLGLAVVAQIVTAHSGTVRATAAPGGGARFVIELPAPDQGKDKPT